MTHPLRAWTPALMLHLTNPCAKRKVLSLTKPKSKIYKTKSLGHYFTISMKLFFVLHWTLSDSKSPQVSRNLLNILSDRNRAVVRMVSILQLISSFTSLSFRPSETIPRTPTTIGITVTIIFLSFFSCLAKSKYLYIFSLSFWSAGEAKSTRLPVFFSYY